MPFGGSCAARRSGFEPARARPYDGIGDLPELTPIRLNTFVSDRSAVAQFQPDTNYIAGDRNLRRPVVP